jgi:hypothetical protein
MVKSLYLIVYDEEKMEYVHSSRYLVRPMYDHQLESRDITIDDFLNLSMVEKEAKP